MRAQELRDKEVAELKELLKKTQREQFNLRMQRASGLVASPAAFKTVGREVARIKTILNEKQTQAES
ncbi:MAG TPA: 50S ribosomal protein L29 [Gammaproteobacteria bacterium]|nr:50S ribosomal protein L29 [Gammaproteobacteria bacterium]HCO61469.1 50S ribosomal protein L29 [Porticoccaceae bacterium]